MKQIIWLLMAIAPFFVLPVSAIQEGVDISGTWMLDRDESDINSASSLMRREEFFLQTPQAAAVSRNEERSGAVPAKKGPATAIPEKRPNGNFPGKSNWQDLELVLIITQSEEELKIVHRYSYEYEDKHITQIFSFGGSQDVNVMRSGRGEYYSNTRLEKGKIINQGIHKVSTSTDNRSNNVTEEYSLSDNGELLILKANGMTPKGEISSRMVFRRK